MSWIGSGQGRDGADGSDGDGTESHTGVREGRKGKDWETSMTAKWDERIVSSQEIAFYTLTDPSRTLPPNRSNPPKAVGRRQLGVSVCHGLPFALTRQVDGVPRLTATPRRSPF